MTKADFKVDFIGIGAPRTGTTWLSACLRQHPDICFSSEKETHFFDLPYNRERGMEYYQSFFADCQDTQLKGEFTPAYYLQPTIATDILEQFPDVKFLVVLRDPVERFISDVNYAARRTGTVPDVDAVIEAGEERFVTAGYYHQHLQAFLAQVPAERCQIVWHHEIASQPEATVRAVYQFLGVDEGFVPPSLHTTHNAQTQVGFRFPALYRLVNYRKRLKRSRVGFWFIQGLKQLGVNRLVRWTLDANYRPEAVAAKVVVSKEQQRKLYQRYASDIRALEETYKVRLDDWHQYDS